MNVLNIEHVSKVFGDKVIFDDVSYGVHDGDKIGIIGINGTGKTTLLKIIAGQEETDEGQVVCQKGLRIAYLPQNPVFPKDATVLSYVTGSQGAENGWDTATSGADAHGLDSARVMDVAYGADAVYDMEQTAESEAKTILTRLDITDYDASIARLSGGQKKRVALAKTLVDPADVLVLDEPTNHIDNEMAAWLEEYLNRFRGVVIMVTHDRYFLDRVTNKILEISHGKLYSYAANYSRFLELKAEREEMELATERKRQSVLRMELEWAKRGCRARSTKQKARLERLEHLKNGTAPVRDAAVELDSVENRMGKKTIALHHVGKCYGERMVIRDFDYIVLKNQRLGIIGPNGCGKSTLMKIIVGELLPDTGEVEIGDTIRIGYFAQEETQMDGKQRVIDFVKDVAEYVPTKDGRISASQMLERFLFDASMQYTPIERLSGGERRRLYLLRVLMEAPNVLILDEPTNDLDIPTLTILEDYLDSFSGIVITVSHDRYFLDNLVDRIFAFEGEGQLVQYEGGYSDYLAAKTARDAQAVQMGRNGKNARDTQVNQAKGAESAQKSGTDGSPNDSDFQARGKGQRPSHQAKVKFTYKEQREFETIDDEIARLEEKIEQLDREMMENATNSAKLSELSAQKEESEQALEEKMDRWVYLNDLAERM